MAKGYPIGPLLQTMPLAESLIAQCHIERVNCGKIATLPAPWSASAHNEFSGEIRLNRLDRAS
jgi:hypothetical protein